MNWSELKLLVETQLKLAGLDDAKIDYFDFCLWTESLRVEIGEFGLVVEDDDGSKA